MIEVLYCNENSIIERLAESLVIGGLPMETKKLTKDDLEIEIENLYDLLSEIWFNKEYFNFDKKEKVIRLGDEVNEDIAEDLKYCLCCSFSDYDTESYEAVDGFLNENLDKYTKRGINLGHVKIGSGHNSMYKGVSFNMIIKFPLYWLKQYQRYNFSDVISSQSTMHKILKFDLKEMFSDEVDDRCIAVIEELRNQYNNESDEDKKKQIWRKIINSCPDGLHMCMGITMNYLQAISMINQRKNHKLSEWADDFIPYLLNLPFLDFLLIKE